MAQYREFNSKSITHHESRVLDVMNCIAFVQLRLTNI